MLCRQPCAVLTGSGAKVVPAALSQWPECEKGPVPEVRERLCRVERETGREDLALQARPSTKSR